MDSFADDLRFMGGVGMAALSPHAQFKPRVIGEEVSAFIEGVPVVLDSKIDPTKIYKLNGSIVCHPWAWWKIRHTQPDPLRSRYSAGRREMERDRRKYGR